MGDFWQNLSDRERLIVVVGGVLAGLLAGFQLIISPIFDWRADQHRARQEAEGLYRLVAEAAPRATRNTETNVNTNTPARNAVSQTASAAGVNLIYVNARDDGAVDANAASVEPAMLYEWLLVLEKEYGILVRTADISRETGDPSKVRVQISLARNGS
ncbi:MAG: type II secretion system protein GspM [Pseudomonadota bacterium]